MPHPPYRKNIFHGNISVGGDVKTGDDYITYTNFFMNYSFIKTKEMNIKKYSAYIIIVFQLLILSQSNLKAGRRFPEPKIAATYKIGIYGIHSITVKKIHWQLQTVGYKIYLFDKEPISPKDTVENYDLTFFLFIDKDSTLYMVNNQEIAESNPFLKFNAEFHDEVSVYIADKTMLPRKEKKKYPLFNFEDPNYTMYNHGIDICDLNSTLNQYSSNSRDPYLALGVSKAYRRINDKENELIFLKKALKLSPNNCEITIALGNFYAKEGQHDQAIELFSKCLNDPMNTSLVYLNLGTIYFKEGDMARAAKFLKKIPQPSQLFGKAAKILYQIDKEKDKEKNENKNFNFLFFLAAIALLCSFYVFIKIRQNKTFFSSATDTEEHIAKIRTLISGDAMEDAFLEVSTLINMLKLRKKYENELIIYKSRWERISLKENLDIESKSDISIEKNRIIQSLLSFLDKIIQQNKIA